MKEEGRYVHISWRPETSSLTDEEMAEKTLKRINDHENSDPADKKDIVFSVDPQSHTYKYSFN